MKRIRLIGLAFLATVVSVLSFTSCDLDDDGYSLGKFWLGLATVHPEGDGAFSLVLDDGTKLWIAASNVYNYHPVEGQRALVDYTILGESDGHFDYYVKLNGIKDILTKGVIDLTPENADSIGHDAIKILKIWVGDNYLNINFGYNVGSEGVVHYINLVNNTSDNDPVDGRIPLEFRHNSNNDAQKYGATGYVAFDLRPYMEEGKESVDFLIKVKDFSNENKEYKITYKYKDSSLTINEELDSNFDATKYK